MLDKEILYLFYYLELSQKEIANCLEIPVGTVKSRLYNAKQNFKEKYPYSASMKGEKTMSKTILTEARVKAEFIPAHKYLGRMGAQG